MKQCFYNVGVTQALFPSSFGILLPFDSRNEHLLAESARSCMIVTSPQVRPSLFCTFGCRRKQKNSPRNVAPVVLFEISEMERMTWPRDALASFYGLLNLTSL